MLIIAPQGLQIVEKLLWKPATSFPFQYPFYILRNSLWLWDGAFSPIHGSLRPWSQFFTTSMELWYGTTSDCYIRSRVRIRVIKFYCYKSVTGRMDKDDCPNEKRTINVSIFLFMFIFVYLQQKSVMENNLIFLPSFSTVLSK